jgi:hypothetical protein
MQIQRLIAGLKARITRFVLGWCAPELIREVYRGLLDRMPDAAEAAAYEQEWRVHRNLSAILESIQQKIFLSRVQQRVNAGYRGLLGRDPDPGGQRTYTEFLIKTRDFPALLSTLAASAEFKQRQFSLLAPEIVSAIHGPLLGRAPDSTELTATLSNLHSERDLAPLIHGLAYSEEIQQRTFLSRLPVLVKDAYLVLMGREPDANGQKIHTDFLTRTEDFAAFFSAISGSQEFGEKQRVRALLDSECPVCGSLFGDDFFHASVTPGMVRAGFGFLLGRPATEAEVETKRYAGWAGGLRKALMGTEEFRAEMTNLFPPKFPTPAEIDAAKTIFLHIPKAGGTTMRDLLEPAFGHDRTCPEHFDGLHCYHAGDLACFRLFSGHFSLQSCDLIPGPKRIFTLLRDPVKRLVSFYNFGRAHSEEIIEREEFWLAALAHRQPEMRGFFSLDEVRRHPLMNNSTVRLLSKSLSGDPWEPYASIEPDSDPMAMLPAAKEALRSMLTFGIVERYDESVELIFRALGLEPPPRIERKNVLDDLAGKVKGIARIERQEYGPETAGVIAPLVEADTLLYQYGVELFERNIETLASR